MAQDSKEQFDPYSQFQVGGQASLVGLEMQVPESVKSLKSFGPNAVDNANVGMEGKMQLDPDASALQMNPEILAQIMSGMFGEGIVEKIARAPTQEERKYWTYFIMDRIASYNDEWPAKSLRESIALRAATKSGALNELRDEKLSSEDLIKQKGVEQSLTLIQDTDKLFDLWFAFYKKLAPSGKISQLAFNELPEYMPPELFARVYGEMPGFKEGDKEWKSMSEQIDIGVRAFMYLALQSDPRWKDDFEWFTQGEGLKKLFPNKASEKEWLYRLKLKTLPNEDNKAAYLYGRSYEDLTVEDKAVLDSLLAFNKFAVPNNGGTVKATMEAIQELMCEGANKDSEAMKFQSQVAINFAEKTFRFFGLAAMYGTRATGFETKIDATTRESVPDYDRPNKINAEDYPWSDYMTDLTRPRDNTVYNRMNSYYEGPVAWANFAPEHIMVDFLRTIPVRDKEFPDSKGKTRSGMELFRDGKTLGEIFKDEDHVQDWGYRAYLIRHLFSLREDNGALLAMNGELTKGDGFKNTNSPIYWEGVEKSIHIVCRDWIVTKGKYAEWFTEHAAEVNSEVDKIIMDPKNACLSDDEVRIAAEDKLLARYVRREKNKWKAIAWLSAIENTLPEERSTIILTAVSVGYLDKAVLEKSRKIDFSKKEHENEKVYLNVQLENFIKSAEDSVN